MATIRGGSRSIVPGATFTSWWTNRYTRGLPVEVRERRIEEIDADVFDHARVVEIDGTRAPRFEIGWRTVRGIPADVSWRRQERQAMNTGTQSLGGTPLSNAWAVITQRWFAPIAVLIGVFNLGSSVAIVLDDGSTMPGRVIGPILLALFGLALFSGLRLRWRAAGMIDVRDPEAPSATGERAQIVPLIVVLVLALALLTVGVSTDAGSAYFVGLGLLVGVCVVVGGTALVRAVRSSKPSSKGNLADALIVIGTLPALGFFWMIIPPLLALAVIGGVLGTNPRLRVA